MCLHYLFNICLPQRLQPAVNGSSITKRCVLWTLLQNIYFGNPGKPVYTGFEFSISSATTLASGKKGHQLLSLQDIFCQQSCIHFVSAMRFFEKMAQRVSLVILQGRCRPQIACYWQWGVWDWPDSSEEDFIGGISVQIPCRLMKV